MTTYDLQRRLIDEQIDSQVRSMIKTLLDTCDLAKFARFLPQASESIRDCKKAETIINLLSKKFHAHTSIPMEKTL